MLRLAALQLTSAYQWSTEERTIPQYVVDTAPFVHLYSEELFYPGSVTEFVPHFYLSTATTNWTQPICISNLTLSAQLLREEVGDPNAELFLTSIDQWQKNGLHSEFEPWLTGYDVYRPNIWSGKIEEAFATLILVEKEEFIDAFWFYFYPYNFGPFVMGRGPFGDHLGDWEHSVIRYRNSTPQIVWMSAHGGGSAFTYEAMTDSNAVDPSRPTIYSARGTHAQYSSPGRHPHDIPGHMLSDYTDAGDLWDPAANFAAYVLDLNTNTLHPANGTVPGRELELGDWLLFDGHWGNKKLSPQDVRQQWSPFEWHLIDGPTGPLTKNLARTGVCERSKWWNLLKTCHVRKSINIGEGWDAEGSRCAMLNKYTPSILKPVMNLVTSGGWLCFWSNRLFS